MFAYITFYSTIFFQVLINTIFHVNWLKKTHRVPLLLAFAYIFAFMWYVCSVLYFVSRIHFLTLISSEVLDLVSSLSITASLVIATYYILTLKPIKLQSPIDESVHYSFALPIHLLLYVGLLTISIVFNTILSIMTR
jgi:hypothetical protein